MLLPRIAAIELLRRYAIGIDIGGHNRLRGGRKEDRLVRLLRLVYPFKMYGIVADHLLGRDAAYPQGIGSRNKQLGSGPWSLTMLKFSVSQPSYLSGVHAGEYTHCAPDTGWAPTWPPSSKSYSSPM